MALAAIEVALQGILSLSPLMLAVQGLVDAMVEPDLPPAVGGSMLGSVPVVRRRRTYTLQPGWLHEEEEALLLALLRH